MTWHELISATYSNWYAHYNDYRSIENSLGISLECPATAVEAPVTPAQPKTQTREFKFDLKSAASSRMVYTGLHVFVMALGDGYNLQVAANAL